jgi:hypothetical protein
MGYETGKVKTMKRNDKNKLWRGDAGGISCATY